MADCHAYAKTVLLHSRAEDCAYFFATFPRANPSKVQGFEYCAAYVSGPTPVAAAAAVAVAPAPAPVTVNLSPVVERVVETKIVYRDKPAPAVSKCVGDDMLDADLAYLHEERYQLRATHQSQAFSDAFQRVEAACVPQRFQRALDG